MNKMMNLKTTVLVLGVLLAGSAFAAGVDADPNLTRSLSGAEVLATGASVSTDSCNCNTVGGTLAVRPDPKKNDYLLPGDAATGGTAAPAGADGIGP